MTSPASNPLQYSIRNLLAVTFSVAAALGIGLLCRDSRYFNGLWSWWTLSILAPLAMVWLMNRFGVKWLAIVAASFFILFVCLPVIQLGRETIWGWEALVWCGVGPVWFFDSLGNPYVHFGRASTCELIGCIVGALANIAFVVAFLALLRGFWSAYARGLSRRVSIPCVLLGAAVILPLALGGELKALYPGYGLWISSFYALALAARQHSMNSELVSQLVNQRALGVEPAHSLDSIVGAADR